MKLRRVLLFGYLQGGWTPRGHFRGRNFWLNAVLLIGGTWPLYGRGVVKRFWRLVLHGLWSVGVSSRGELYWASGAYQSCLGTWGFQGSVYDGVRQFLAPSARNLSGRPHVFEQVVLRRVLSWGRGSWLDLPLFARAFQRTPQER